MYSLDINFLNDRPEYKPDTAKRAGGRVVGTAGGSRRPLWIGLAVGILPVLLAVGSWLFLQNTNSGLRERSTELESQLEELRRQQGELKRLQDQVKQARDEATALATVFNQVRPWSALMQDLQDRIPPNVQVTGVAQLSAQRPGAPQPSPSPTSPTAVPPSILEIVGSAASFDDVNDFLLMVQRSPLVDGKQVRIIEAKRETQVRTLQPLSLQNTQQTATREDPPELPRVVNFKIQANLTDLPATELIDVLNAKGAKGLVTRLRALQQKGLGQPTEKNGKPAPAAPGSNAQKAPEGGQQK